MTEPETHPLPRLLSRWRHWTGRVFVVAAVRGQTLRDAAFRLVAECGPPLAVVQEATEFFGTFADDGGRSVRRWTPADEIKL